MTAETNETILIVDDDPTNVKLLAAKLNDADYTILKAYGGQEALEVAQSQSPGLVLLDVMMPGLNGFDVTAQLKKSPQTSDIPIILVTALDGSDNKTKGLEAGADDFLNKPVNTAELKARVKSLLRMKRYSDQLKARAFTKKMTLSPLNDEETVAELRLPTLLIVEDSASDAKLIRSLLNNLPCTILTAQSGEEALSICRNRKVDVMILDLMLPGLDGYEVVKQIKEKAATQAIQIIVVTSLQDIDSKVKGFEFGVDDFLVKPIHFNEFLARVNSLLKKKAYHDKLMGSFEAAVQAAITDKLTGVYNSGYFQLCLKNELKRADRHHHPVSLLMMDIDDFKQVNDRHGHLAGDTVLQAIAAQIGGSIRDIDILARFGGDEFAIILPFTQQKSAAAVAERIRRAIEEFAFAVNEQTSLNISLSIGVAEYAIGAETAQEMIHRADQALYAAKSDRKNNVCSAAAGA
ncbi:MAG: response regulator [Deltaproteobacteria bacterium]|nr:response regulator [Deltaproteobacteria bacterium]